MDFGIKHAMQLCLVTVLVSVFLYNFSHFSQQFEKLELNHHTSIVIPKTRDSQIELKVEPIALTVNKPYSLLEHVEAWDSYDGHLENEIEVYDNIDISKKGYYKARFVVKNSAGHYKDKTVEVRVDE